MPWSSNATFLVELCSTRHQARASTSRPAASVRCGTSLRALPARGGGVPAVARPSSWGVVPETVLRDAAPLGPGSLQRFVEADFEHHYFTLYEEESERWHDELRRLCVFDLLANSTDRKSGHCLFVPDDGAAHLRHRQRAEFPRRVQVAHGDLGVRRRGHPRSSAGRRRPLRRAGMPDGLAELLDPFERDALLARGRRVRPRTALPDRRQRTPVSLAACLTPAIPSSTSCSARSSRLCRARDWEGLLALRTACSGVARTRPTALAGGRVRRVPVGARGAGRVRRTGASSRAQDDSRSGR